MLRLSLRKSQFVVCDRYFYQYFYDLYGPAARRVASAFPRPNVAIWLDGGIETIRSRVSDSDADVTYLEAVMKMYKEISGDLGFVRVDASPDAKVVEEEVWRHVRKVVPGCPA
jgi:thymidylate kinase